MYRTNKAYNFNDPPDYDIRSISYVYKLFNSFVHIFIDNKLYF